MSASAADIGILGGSFNPPHIGHLIIASEAHHALGLECVIFVPAWSPPHKRIEDDVPAAVRLELTRLAVQDDPRFEVSDIEVRRRLRYTVDTVTALATEHSGRALWFIVGSDSLLALDTWRDPEGILARARLAVAPRPGDADADVDRAAARWGGGVVTVLDSARVAISSTLVRERVRAGAPVRYMVPEAVGRVVAARGLYRG